MNNAQAFPTQAMPLDRDVLLKAEGISKTYTQGGRDLQVLNKVDLKIDAGEIVALVGPSGSGKSTLLQILGLLDQPSSGHLRILDEQAEHLGDGRRTKLRQEKIGFIYQFHHLLPEFTALENVMMPQIIAKKSKEEAASTAEELLTSLGLKDRTRHRPSALSGGEQQRVAIARALANDPKILLADEPTGNLDPGISGEVFDLLVRQVRQRNMGAFIATHNMDLAEQMDRVLEVKMGKVIAY